MAELRNGEGRGTTIRAKSCDCKRGAGRRNPLVASRQVLGACSSPTPSRAFIVLRRRLVAIIPLCLVATVPLTAQRRAAAPVAATGIDTTSYAQLKFRHIGPEGNRVSSIAGVAGDVSVYYAGAASGGLWKTVDGGIRWQPIFDDQPVSSIGALAVAPSDPNVVWAGTGEPFIRSNISVGWGVYKSTDAGKHWTKMGLDSTGRISRVVVHPTNPDIVYVAALGHLYGPQPQRGIYRTTDGGKTWERVLFVNDSTGASDLVMDPNNPRILFAGFWQVEVHTCQNPAKRIRGLLG